MTDEKGTKEAQQEDEFVPSRTDQIVAFAFASPIFAVMGLFMLLVVVPMVIVKSFLVGDFRGGGKLLVTRLLPTVTVLVAIYYGLKAVGWVA